MLFIKPTLEKVKKKPLSPTSPLALLMGRLLKKKGRMGGMGMRRRGKEVKEEG